MLQSLDMNSHTAQASPRFSIVVLNWNSLALLRQCLDAIRAQSLRSFEVLIVDNGSSDGSRDWLAAADLGQAVNAPARAILLERNTGFAAGMNAGIRAAAGEWVTALNVDAFPAEDFLEQAAQAAARHPEASALGARVCLYAGGRTETVNCSAVWLSRRMSVATLLGDPDAEAEVFGPAGCCPTYKRAALLASQLEPAWTGGDAPQFYDELYFAYGEDVDLYLRLQLLGQRCWYIPSMRVWHVHSATQAGVRWWEKDRATLGRLAANVFYTWLKNCPAGMLLRFAPVALLAPLGMAAALLLRAPGKCLAPLRALSAIIAHLPRTLRIRRALQRQRVQAAPKLLYYRHNAKQE